jgi:hypothetical protein
MLQRSPSGLLPARLGRRDGRKDEDVAMSSGLLHNMAQGREGEGAAHAKWAAPVNWPVEESARSATGCPWHFHVELPSRRWYVEAARPPAGPE